MTLGVGVTQGKAVVSLAKSAWPVLACLIVIITVQRLWFDRYQVSGHAADHLSSASAAFAISFLVAVAFWANAGMRRDLKILTAVAIITVGLAGIVYGNLQIVDAIN